MQQPGGDGDRATLEDDVRAGMASEIDEDAWVDDLDESDESDDDEDGADDSDDDEDPDDEDGHHAIDELGLPMPVLTVEAALELLTHGEIEVVGRLSASTNNAMLAVARGGGLEAACIYKPVIGERPLIDFPDGTLARREVAAFLASNASGWNIVPATVLRDAHFGEGMVQLWIRADPEADPVEMVIGEDPRLRSIAVFDAAVNNTDRKAGHLVVVPGGHVYGVDHGVTFSPVPKLRTVLWAWRGLAFSEEEAAVLASLRAGLDGALGAALRALLDPIEVAATGRRIDRLLEAGVFPQPDPRRPAMPWPPV
ncbi:MAG: SCO1664 family protein [Chloroflexota bacterium]